MLQNKAIVSKLCQFHFLTMLVEVTLEKKFFEKQIKIYWKNMEKLGFTLII